MNIRNKIVTILCFAIGIVYVVFPLDIIPANPIDDVIISVALVGINKAITNRDE